MPVEERRLVKEITAARCSVERTKKGHFIVLDPNGNPIASYAVRHPGKEVRDCYVSDVRKALAGVKP